MESVQSKYGSLLINMPSDHEIAGRFYFQAREIFGDDLNIFFSSEEQRERFITVLLDVMIKLDAMRYHLNQFKALEQEYYHLINNTDKDKETFNRTHVLLFEFESFLFQMKSSLDVGAEFLSALIPDRFATKTFTEKGAKIIRGLGQYRNDRKAKVELVDGMIDMIIEDRGAWLEQAIKLRDDIAHFKTYSEFNYQFTKTKEKEIIHTPKIAGKDPVEYMETIYANCIEFLQDYMCISIGLFLPPGFSVGVRAEGHKPKIGPPLDSYVKFSFGIEHS